MKLREIFLFEIGYQFRSPLTWVYLALAFLLPFYFSAIGENTDSAVHLNAPSILILLTIFLSVILLLITGAVAGYAAARDIQTRMHAILYTAPISKFEYLSGRFLAAFLINALIHLMVPVAFFLSFHIRTVDPAMLGPFRWDVYVTTYCYLSLPLAFVATACQFSVAVLDRRTITAFIVSIILFPIITVFFGTSIGHLTGNWEFVKLFDLVGIMSLDDMGAWTPFEQNTRVLELEGIFLLNRLSWIAVAIALLVIAYSRFKFVHHTQKSWGRFFVKRKSRPVITASNEPIASVQQPLQKQVFGFASEVRQMRAIAWSSFEMIAKSKTGLITVGLFALHLVAFAHEYLKSQGVPQYATTMNVLTLITAPVRNFQTPLIIIPLLIVFYAGELVWKEREAGLDKISDTTPVSEWIILTGKFLGLSLLIIVWIVFLVLAGILIQVSMGNSQIEFTVYVQALLGFQLIDYLLFAMLALAVHVIVNQKYLGHAALLFIYIYIAFANKLGIEHNLLIYGADPGLLYTDMRGFEPYLKPWFWFKLYWAGWAILLAVVARLLLVRSVVQGASHRILLTRHRFTKITAAVAIASVMIISGSGLFIFYNTNVVNDYITVSDRTEQLINYEKRFKRYQNLAQPLLTAAKFHVEIYPDDKKADISGTYTLVNNANEPIDTIQVSTQQVVRTEELTFDQPFKVIQEDQQLGYYIYALNKPIEPGDSVNLSFQVQFSSKGFSNSGISSSVIENGTYFINYDWLPAIGYQRQRELRDNANRKKYGLTEWIYPSLYDSAAASRIMPGQELIKFEAIVGTADDQIAITAGKQVRQWKKNGRNYFKYAASSPIRNTFSFFSARYAMHKEKWNDVDIQMYYHPDHGANLTRIIESTKASLAYYTQTFGPYPYTHLTILERSGYEGELNAEPTTIDYGESFTLSNLQDNPWALDIVYFAIAHEVAHQWWGAAQLIPAQVEGGILISETLANHSGLKVLEEKYGEDQVNKLLSMWRASYEVPRVRDVSPLLQAKDAFLGYRKGPIALYALSSYTNKHLVNSSLKQLMLKHGAGKTPFPTSLDLYRELKQSTPDTLQYLLRDLFEKNIYWQFKTEQATATRLDSAHWQVTLTLSAKKLTVDSTGAEITLPMNDWVEIGIYTPWEEGQSIKTLHLEKYQIKSGQQTINVIVTDKPGQAGVDPNYLLIDLNPEDNIRKVKIENNTSSGRH